MINLLDKKTAELIAAGEVVERPASVVKELVENAIDSGASHITVRLKNGGLNEITVIDDGCGIAFDEIETAFLRHATSKIAAIGDLDSLNTLGFRGEALPSIASVSRLTLRSKRADDEFGGEYVAEGGVKTSLRRVGCPDGTVINVRELFYNTPARMKFLKSDASEGNAAAAVVEQQALAHPEVAFSLYRDERQVMFTPGDNRLLSAVFAVFPRSLAAALVPVDGEKGGISVNGYICRPEAKRASRALQYVYVNGRYVKDRTVVAAVEEAFRSFAGGGGYPAYVINIEISPALVDVNVHPAKTEVRFADERGLFSAVYSAVKIAVADASGEAARMTAEPQTTLAPELKIVEPVGERPKTPETSGGIVGFVEESRGDFSAWPDILHRLSQYRVESDDVAVNPAPQQQTFEPVSDGEPLRYIGELFSTYIIAARGDDAVVIDKHAAHERLLYEKFTAENVGISRQVLLSPVVVELSRGEKALLLENKHSLLENGFVVEDFGERAVVVREIPVFYRIQAAERAVLSFCEQLSKNSTRLTDDSTVWLFRSLACRAAVKAGDSVEPEMLMAIAADILDERISKYCPHGRPVLFIISKKELEKRFERG